MFISTEKVSLQIPHQKVMPNNSRMFDLSG
uniref:Uncharacterized protein n=1 Tax=Rhizophora mucronata TaxID=61149 RepID=A0A2P2MYF7_RHIMU